MAVALVAAGWPRAAAPEEVAIEAQPLGPLDGAWGTRARTCAVDGVRARQLVARTVREIVDGGEASDVKRGGERGEPERQHVEERRMGDVRDGIDGDVAFEQ